MTATLPFWAALAGLAAACLAAIGGRAIAQFSPHELKEICRRGNHPDRLGHILKRRDQVGLAAETLQALATMVYVGAASLWILPERPPHGPLLPASVAAAATVLLAGEIWLPWAIVRLWASPFLYYTWPAWRALAAVLSPLTLAARFVDAMFHRLAGRRGSTRTRTRSRRRFAPSSAKATAKGFWRRRRGK